MDDRELGVGGEVVRLDGRAVRGAGDEERALRSPRSSALALMPSCCQSSHARRLARRGSGSARSSAGGVAGEDEVREDGLAADAAGELGDPGRAVRVRHAVDVVEIRVAERPPAAFGLGAGDDEARGVAVESRAAAGRSSGCCGAISHVAFEVESTASTGAARGSAACSAGRRARTRCRRRARRTGGDASGQFASFQTSATSIGPPASKTPSPCFGGQPPQNVPWFIASSGLSVSSFMTRQLCALTEYE